MSFKYTAVSDTFSFIGYDVLESPREILQAVKDTGYEGVDLPGNPKRMKGREMRQIVESVGLTVPELLGAWTPFHAGEHRDLAGGNEEARQRTITYAKQTIDLAAEIGAQFLGVVAAQPPAPELPFPKLPIKTLRANFLEALREVCTHAAVRGITVLFEPLNAYEAYPGVLTSISEAISLCEELHPHDVGIQPDISHMNSSDPAIPDALRAAGKYVRHVHVNETHRYRLGTGHADWRGIMRALKDIHFDGYLAVYMPYSTQQARMALGGYEESEGAAGSGAGGRPDLRAHLEGALSFLKDVERSVELEKV